MGIRPRFLFPKIETSRRSKINWGCMWNIDYRGLVRFGLQELISPLQHLFNPDTKIFGWGFNADQGSLLPGTVNSLTT